MTVKYFWKKLTEDGLLKGFKKGCWDDYEFGQFGYDTKEEAIADFENTFKDMYLQNEYVLVTFYGANNDYKVNDDYARGEK